MTIQEGTICNLVQTFPILLILAQNNNKCLKTPFVYKPPSPTPSTEYYEALDALFQSLFGHGYHEGGHGCNGHGHGHGQGVYYGKHAINQGHVHIAHPCYSYGYPSEHGHGGHPTYPGHNSHSFGTGHPYGTTYGYPSYHGYAVPNYGYKKLSVYNITGSHGYKSYAPTQVYNMNHKYKVVVKKNKTKINRRRPQKLRMGSFFNRENRRYPPQFGFQNGLPNFRERLSSALHHSASGNHRVVAPNYENRRPYTENPDGQVYRNSDQVYQETPQQNRVRFPDHEHLEVEATSEPAVNFPVKDAEATEVPKLTPVMPDYSLGTDRPFTSAPVEPAPKEPTTVAPTEPENNDHNEGLSQLTPVPTFESRFNVATSGIFTETCQVESYEGTCIPILNCEPYVKMLQQSRSNPSVAQFLRKTHCGFEGNYPKVCCPLPTIPNQPPTPETTPIPTNVIPLTTPAPATTPEQKSDQVDASDYIPNLPEPPECGTSNATFGRVVGGVDAKLGDFPWMALLGYKRPRGNTEWLCGGSLVSSKHVLTASHCIHGHEKQLYVIRVGELDLAKEDEGATPVDILIKKQIKHPQYNSNTFSNDIALLLLERDVEFTHLIRPICIPRSRELRQNSFENYTPIVAGWGSLEFRGPSAQILQALQLPVVSNDFCREAYKAYPKHVIDNRILCAGYKKGGKDACQGDSGGPLMQPIWNSQTLATYIYQIGVVSFGKKCAEPGFPGVYSRVTTFVPWLEETMIGPNK